MIPAHRTADSQATATTRVDRVIASAAAGRTTISRAWHQLRCWQPTLEQWKAFHAIAVARGERWHRSWPTHQWKCWTLESSEGTYPEQRAQWRAKQAQFEGAMATKRHRPVLTNAQLRRMASKAAEPDHVQLALIA